MLSTVFIQNRKLRGTWLALNKKSRKLIAKARLRMRVTSKGGTTIIGTIKPSVTCGGKGNKKT